jgi:hypothetical protein
MEDYEGKETYGLEAVFPEGTDLTEDHGRDKNGEKYISLKNLAKRVAADKWGKNLPKGLKSPFIDGSEYNETHDNPRQEIERCTIMRLRTTTKPNVRDIYRQKVTDESEVYPGRLARASVYCRAYDNKGSKGVHFLLNNVQIFEEDDVRWGAVRRSAESEFDDDMSKESDAAGEFNDSDSTSADDMWG